MRHRLAVAAPLALALTGLALVGFLATPGGLSPNRHDASNGSVARRLVLTTQSIVLWGTDGVGAAAALETVALSTVKQAELSASDGVQHQQQQQRCAIFNSVDYHADVAAGVTWAFQEAGCNVTCYVNIESYGIQSLMEGWYKGSYEQPRDLFNHTSQYDVIVIITFPEGKPGSREYLFRAGAQRQLLAQLLGEAAQEGVQPPPAHQRFLLVVHNPDALVAEATWQAKVLQQAVQQEQQQEGGAEGALQKEEEQQQQQAEAAAEAEGGSSAAPAATTGVPRVQLLALAPCVSAYIQSLVQTWHAGLHGSRPRVEVPWLAPLVPWWPSFSGGVDIRNAGSGVFSGANRLRHICIQGKIEAKRRDYDAAFAAASHPAVLAQLRKHNESLLLVGKDTGKQLDVPQALKAHVRILADLPYQEYYDTLSRCRVILTAFNSDVYLYNKASSTLAASVHVGTPLVTEDRVVKVYTYMRPEAVFTYNQTREDQQAEEEEEEEVDAAALGAQAAVKALAKLQSEASATRKLKQQGMQLAEGLADSVSELSAAVFGKKRQLAEAASRGKQRKDAANADRRAEKQGQEGEEVEQPEPGTYAAALLRAFTADHSAVAHEAARQLKQEIMQHNIQVARQFLEGATAATAAMAASAAR